MSGLSASMLSMLCFLRFKKPSSDDPAMEATEEGLKGGFPDSWPWSHIITPNSDGSTELASEWVGEPVSE